jgi:hypothetical protein
MEARNTQTARLAKSIGPSPELKANALDALACPVIAIIPDGKQLGSGVLVEVDGVLGILTAQHVVFSKEFQQAQGLWTIPHIYSAENVEEKTAHFSATSIRRDLLRFFPKPRATESIALNGDRISLSSEFPKTLG